MFYGYSVTTGRDGKPTVREFGNLKHKPNGTFEIGSREPFVDTVLDEKENKIKIIAEIPGVHREDIKLVVEDNSVSIHAEHEGRTYNTSVPLHVPVEPSTATATYNNGILEVVLRLKPDQVRKGVRIHVD